MDTTNVSAQTKAECIDSHGIWDYPPQDDNECPYYLANQNYPNQFGHIQNSKCQLPKNMQIIGYRNYSKNLNCNNHLINNGSLGFCCDEQLNKSLYPNLNTPDYAFIGDTEIRQKYNNILNSRNLNIN
jgi:hypothetical protein